jgi:plastocyanin
MTRSTREFIAALGATLALTLIAEMGGGACGITTSAPHPTMPPPTRTTRTVTLHSDAAAQEVTIKVTDNGFEPAKVNVKKDTPVKLTFLRTSKTTCATEVLIPDQKISKKLPLNEPVTIDLTFKQAGDVTFMCGEKMYKGQIVVAQD